MSSISSPSVIIQMLENNGTFPGDPQCHSIWAYTSDWDTPTYKLIYGARPEQALFGFISSPYVHRPVLLWSQANGLSPDAVDLFPHLAKYFTEPVDNLT